MRTTLRPRRSAPFPSQPNVKRRRLNGNDSPFSQSQLQSFHDQLLAIKNKHNLDENVDASASNKSSNKKPNDEQNNEPPSKAEAQPHSIRMITNPPKPSKQVPTNANKKQKKANTKPKSKRNQKSSAPQSKSTQPTRPRQPSKPKHKQKATPKSTARHKHKDKANTDVSQIDDHQIHHQQQQAQPPEHSPTTNTKTEHRIHSTQSIQDTHDIHNEESDEDWNAFINAVDFQHKTKRSEHGANVKITDEIQHRTHQSEEEQPRAVSPPHHELAERATATESEWLDFLNTRYDEDDQRKSDWKPPEIHTFWDQGPIGQVMSWWDDSDGRTFVNETEFAAEYEAEKQRQTTTNLSKDEISKKQQQRTIKKDIMKELKQQKLEKKLRERIEGGEVVKDMNADNSVFESFFDAALSLGNNLRDGVITKEQLKKESKPKTKIIRPQIKKLKEIATFENDGLFFFDDNDHNDDDEGEEHGDGSDAEREKTEGFLDNINEHDMIYVNENSVVNDKEGNVNVAVLASKVNAEQLLIQQRVIQQHQAMAKSVADGMANEMEQNKQTKKKWNVIGKGMKDGVLDARMLSDTVEDSMKEKKILKRLNVMDYVHNYKDSFFREVEELNLNAAALVDNWQTVKKHDGLSRKLKKKLGIMMARERKKRTKQNKMQSMIDEMVNVSSSESESDDEDEDMQGGDNESESNTSSSVAADMELGTFLDDEERD